MTTDFETKTMLLSELNPAAYNPRAITDQALAGLTKSVERFGLVQPVIWNKQTGNVVGGHQRLKVLESLGKKETIVVVVDMPEAEEKALNVSLNNPKIQGDFTDGLSVLLADIEIDLPDLDFGEIGLDDMEIPDVDLVPEEGDEPIDYEQEWQGMPEYNNSLKSFKTIHVHFETQEQVDTFAILVNQKITEKTTYLWYPPKNKDDLKSQGFRSEP